MFAWCMDQWHLSPQLCEIPTTMTSTWLSAWLKWRSVGQSGMMCFTEIKMSWSRIKWHRHFFSNELLFIFLVHCWMLWLRKKGKTLLHRNCLVFQFQLVQFCPEPSPSNRAPSFGGIWNYNLDITRSAVSELSTKTEIAQRYRFQVCLRAVLLESSLLRG